MDHQEVLLNSWFKLRSMIMDIIFIGGRILDLKWTNELCVTGLDKYSAFVKSDTGFVEIVPY